MGPVYKPDAIRHYFGDAIYKSMLDDILGTKFTKVRTYSAIILGPSPDNSKVRQY